MRSRTVVKCREKQKLECWSRFQVSIISATYDSFRYAGKWFSVFCGFCSSHTPRCLNPSPFWPILNPNNTRDLLFAYSYTPSKFISCFCGPWRLCGTRPDFTSFSHQPQLDFVVFLSQPGGLPHVSGLPCWEVCFPWESKLLCPWNKLNQHQRYPGRKRGRRGYESG